ncbi:hypothetical protein GRX03_07240 [Halovenus sp. WSH3]|uniref:Uncharacterized protein n=1 Tax=Halovenus carboxidivorans TaxID=2692199 RepID=A0A6B0T5D5_9EURY|nr:hypothetical protein [Halovenus carboxidivorans]MXR51396.1 hypothetical protein [Halovenus carboxidivorans]
MPDRNADSAVSAILRGSTWDLLLGVTYVVTGVALLVSLFTGSLELVVAALVSILLLVVLSLGTAIRREGLVTEENGIIAACVLTAMGLLFVLSAETALSSEVIFGIVFFVGVIVPHLLVSARTEPSP